MIYFEIGMAYERTPKAIILHQWQVKPSFAFNLKKAITINQI